MLTTFRIFCTSHRILKLYSDSSLFVRDDFLYKNLCLKIRNAVQLSLRDEDLRTQDHIHKGRVEFNFEENESLSEMLLRALGANTKNVKASALEIHNEKLYIKQEYLEEWQCEVTAYQNTVPLLVAAWEIYDAQHHRELKETAQQVIQTLKHSTLPGVCDHRFNSLIQNDEGTQGNLHDLHVHFNGTTEFAPVWLHALAHRQETRHVLMEAHGARHADGKVPLFYKQIHSTPQKMYALLCRANAIRELLCKIVFCGYRKISENKNLTYPDMVWAISGRIDESDCGSAHPFQHEDVPLKCTDLQREGIMWLYVLRTLRETRNHALAILAHVYILLANQYLRLLVQQRDQFGFDQFQYITVLGAREPLEDSNTYQRFVQFHGMYGPDLAHIEARFSPKQEIQKSVKLLKSIWDGYKKIHEPPQSTLIPCLDCPKITQLYRILHGQVLQKSVPPIPKPTTLGLVAHFIKERESNCLSYRHQRLRVDLYKKAAVLAQTRKYFRIAEPELYEAIVGKDAAANELETPPEVFAPVFRFLHHEGLCKTTYHAGEDYEHVLSGIRAVSEAITFLNLGSGDRIGHATALGINPEKANKESLHCAQGHWLDNLVWLTWIIAKKDSSRLENINISLFETNIQELYENIFGKGYPGLPILWRAWAMRFLDMVHFHKTVALPSFDHQRIESRLLQKAKKDEPAFKEFQKYHSRQYRKAWAKQIQIKKSHIDNDLLRAIQDTIIDEMRQKNIIIEVLPTSNIRISHYDVTEEHHILRWLDDKDERPAPHVVLGTDDPGIFATNLRNEYALLLHTLQEKYTSKTEKPYQILQHLIENGRSYRFKNTAMK